MATLDIILLICFLPGIIRGISKGFLEQALALAGVVLSVWAAFRFSGLVATWLKPYADLSETTLNGIHVCHAGVRTLDVNGRFTEVGCFKNGL